MSPSPSDVSVVTVTWNGKSHLQTLLPTLAATGCGEILVVDNGSSDGSQALVRESFPAIHLIQNETNQGFAHPCNQAAETASGRYLAFINNDMKAHPDWLRKALPLLGGPTVCAASRILNWSGEQIDFNGSSLQYLGYASQRDIGRLVEEVSQDGEILFPCGGAMLIDREVFLEVGGFDPDYFALFEDVDLGWRLWVMGYRVAFAADSVTYHRGHSTLKTKTLAKVRYLMHRNALLTILKNYDDEHFQKILPVAIRLAIKRAVHFSGVDPEAFYMWSDVEAKLKDGDSEAQKRLLDSLNHLVAVDDVLKQLPDLMQKRKRIQGQRRRSDAEIFELFKDPFRLIVEDPDYAHEEMRLIHGLNFPELGLDQHKKAAAQLPEQLSGRIEKLSRELSRSQWIAQRYLSQDPLLPQHSLGELVTTLRREGVRETWRRLKERVEDGL